ncbi:MAG: nicotinate (nicotinamide) nucleotide adenylyltransferase [Bacteroidia bacterium]|nr:nicotinate (nicotinamide) nucleotide adenylyltransferase [Bacteroidia bacterium]
MRVGLYFGSFNPIHHGHLILAQTFLNESGVNQVWLVISPQNPFKTKQSLANETDRFCMAELATQGHEYLFPSNVEFYLPTPSYTIDTLNHLKQLFPTYSFELLMGEDNLITLPKWKSWEEIINHHLIHIYPRITTEKSNLNHPNLRFINAPLLELSSTKIRELIRAGKSVRYYVPDSVLDYIESRRLYV